MKHLAPWLLLMGLLLGCEKKAAEPTAAAGAGASQSPAFQVDAATAGSVHGVISFSGAAPKPQRIDMSQDPGCMAGNPAPNLGEAFAVRNGRLGNVFLYIKDGLEGKTFAEPAEAVVLDQLGCRYVPHVMGAMAGQTVRILNSDPTMHNVHPAAEVNSMWNVSQQPGGAAIEKRFPKPELMIPVKCNQHPWMKMFLSVTSNPFYAVSKPDGSYEIRGLPPGTYTLGAVHERLGEMTAKITVPAKGAATADLKFSCTGQGCQ